MPHYTTTNKNGRDAAREAHPRGHHATPVSCIVALFHYMHARRSLKPQRILDPGAGDLGNFGFAAKAVWPDAHVAGVEIRPEANPPTEFYDSFNYCDFLSPSLIQANTEKFDFITTNPTFNIAESVIRSAIECLKPGGTLALFLPQNFQFGAGRAAGLHLDYPPALVMPICPRPSFYWYRPDKQNSEEKNHTNYRDYNWIVWQKPERGHAWHQNTRWMPFTWGRNDAVENKFRAHFAYLKSDLELA